MQKILKDGFGDQPCPHQVEKEDTLCLQSRPVELSQRTAHYIRPRHERTVIRDGSDCIWWGNGLCLRKNRHCEIRRFIARVVNSGHRIS